MALTDAIQSVPKPALFIAGGLGIGGLVLVMRKNQTPAPTAEDTGMAEPVEVGSSSPSYGYGAGSAAGVIVPPVIISGGSDSNATGILSQGLSELQGLYVSGTEGLLSKFSDVLFPTLAQQANITNVLLDQNMAIHQQTSETIATLASAGAAPASAAVQGPVTFAPVPQPAARPVPAPAPARPAFKTTHENRTRRKGKNVWCSKVTIHRYPDGRAVVAGEAKIKNGSC